ncbi:MAG TPA: WD40 repeat domain-containing serine/threonine-protein kinase [Pirellulales bacterium]|nr:WD40 repeat domain-containing serine/threonine-protein kinase [Pirellulales bacterium]
MSSTDRPSSGRQRAPDDARTQLRSVADAFERAWQHENAPNLDAFVNERGETWPRELAALACIDLDARWRRDQPCKADEYLERFPRLAADAESAIDVIYAEYLARERAGSPPDLDEYRQRFPDFADVLCAQIQLHNAIESVEDDPIDPSGETQLIAEPQGDESRDAPLDQPTYEILEVIGRGGMAVVYRARQTALNRFVALKMVRAIDASNLELLARFRSEARVVAALDHPHIVKVFDYGEHDALPYIAMELIEGGSLADRLDGTPWPPRAAAELISKLAAGVSYAHERQVVHRDLKPANVLIASDGKPLEVKITDFGLAKFYADDSSSHTKSNAFFGTPSYMAPEQAKGRYDDIGTASDIYSLGAILYELLTGRPPFRGESPMETLRLLISGEPVPTQRMAPCMPRDLATICDKCLHGDIARRYASAHELQEDIERYLAGKPILARQACPVERAWRWCKRNPSLATALGSVAALLFGIAVVALWYSGQLNDELSKTLLANCAAQERLWDAYITEANARNSSQQVGQRFASLDTIEKAAALLPAIGRTPERQLQLRNAVLGSVALPDLRTARTIAAIADDSYAADMSVAADCYIVASTKGTLTGYRLSDAKQRWSVPCPTAFIVPVLSRDGRFAASVGNDVTQVWLADGSQPQLAWQSPGAQYLSFDHDGRFAACSDPEQGMRLVHAADGSEVRALGKGAARSNFSFHEATGRIAVCVGENVQIIDLENGQVTRELPIGAELEQRIAWHPSGEHLAIWSRQEIAIWNVRTRTKKAQLAHRGVPARLVFNKDGSLLASQSLWDSRLLVWDPNTGERFLEVPEFASMACDAANERRIVFLSKSNGALLLTQLEAGACRSLAQALDPPLGWWCNASVSPEGRIIAFSCHQGLELWDLQTMRRLLAWPIGDCWAEFDRQGRLIISCIQGVYRLEWHDESAGENVSTAGKTVIAPGASSNSRTLVNFGPPERLAGPIVPSSLALNDGGETLLMQDGVGWFVHHSGNSGSSVRLQIVGDPRKGALSNDDHHAVVANWERGGARIWDARSGTQVNDLAIGRHGIVKFSPNNRLLAATPDGVTVWDTRNWTKRIELHAAGTTPTGLGIGFSPDSRVLAVGQINGVLKLVDPLTGEEWARLSRRDLRVATTIAFGPKQRLMVTASIDERSTPQVWDLVSMRRELAQRGLDLPADVLTAGPAPSGIGGKLEVRIDDGNQFKTRPLSMADESPGDPAGASPVD